MDEVHIKEYSYKKTAVESLKALAVRLWQHPKLRTLQTSLEGCVPLIPEEEILAGECPAAYPFAILTEEQYNCIPQEKYKAEQIGRGVLVMPKWNTLI
jgi:hypothetical protein